MDTDHGKEYVDKKTGELYHLKSHAFGTARRRRQSCHSR